VSILARLTPTSLFDEPVLARADIVGVDVDTHLVRSHIANRRVQAFVYIHTYVSTSLRINTARPARLEIAQLVAAVIAPTVPVIALLSIIMRTVATEESLV
jgi:hypothetical protein